MNWHNNWKWVIPTLDSGEIPTVGITYLSKILHNNWAIDVFDAAFTPVFVLVVCLGVLACCLCRSVTVIVTT